ncbi:TetR/AcrR family transcriptional regulator [Sneathiella litorea]|nr:TetR/AcrR family transcriptional regulator [Sneathiella litorea]
MEKYSNIKTFSLTDFLVEHSQNVKGKRKRYRTRAKILMATALEMERVGFENMTVDGIVETVDMARGTFYLYFENRAEAAKAVIRRYEALRRRIRPRNSTAPSIYEKILEYNLYYIGVYARNAGLLAGREMLMREAPEQNLRRDQMDDRWARVVMRDLYTRNCITKEDLENPATKLMVRTAISMADDLLRETFVYKSPSMAEFAKDEKLVAEVVSLAWYRILYGKTPDLKLLDKTRSFAENTSKAG